MILDLDFDFYGGAMIVFFNCGCFNVIVRVLIVVWNCCIMFINIVVFEGYFLFVWD